MTRKLTIRSLLCLSLSCAGVLSTSFASAAPPVQPVNDDDAIVTMARERFKEGVEYFDQKQYDKARAAFLQAYALKKHPAVLLNLAQSELRSGHEVDAAKHFAAYLREGKEATDAEKQAAVAGLTTAKGVVAEGNLSVNASDAEVYVDGVLAGNAPLGRSIYLAAGPHTLEARKDGRSTTQQINAIAGQHFDAELKFEQTPAPPTAPVESAQNELAPAAATSEGARKPFFKWLAGSPVGIVGLSLTGVGLGGGLGFAFASKQGYNNANSVASQITSTASTDATLSGAPATTSTSGLCQSPSAWLSQVHYTMDPNAITTFSARSQQYEAACSKYQDNVNTGDRMKMLATVGFAVAGVAAVGTIVYYFLDPSAKEQAPQTSSRQRGIAIVPTLGPGERGLSVSGTF